jgi:hypothetical protein
VTHGDAIVNGYGVKLGGKATEALNLSLDLLAYLVQMGVTRHELSE